MNTLVRSFLSAILWTLLLTSSAVACLWPPGEHDRVGEPIDLSDMDPKAYIGVMVNGQKKHDYWQQVLDSVSPLAKARRENRSLDNRVAVALIHLGRVTEAISILEKLERSRPGSYDVAANLGTAYELVGDNEKAAKWITESIKRNPESHFGTEWLHLMILEAKQAIKIDPNWADRHSVLGIDWQAIKSDLSLVAVRDDRGMLHTAADVQKAIEYQLYERTEFVKPPDPTVASLLYDLSHLVRISKSEEHGTMAFGMAIHYGYPFQQSQESPTMTSQMSYWRITAIVIPLLVLLLVGSIWLAKRGAKQIN